MSDPTELEIEPCDDVRGEQRHGEHPWSAGNSYEYQCPGYGVITVSYSEIDTFRQCPKKHDLGYMQRWQKEPKDTGALGKGSLWHRVLETHYRTIQAAQVPSGNTYVWDVEGAGLLIACQDAVATLLTQMLEVEQRDVEVIGILRWAYAGYVEMYGLDEEWDILEVENNVIVPLYEAEGSESWVRLKIKLDLLVRDSRGRIWVVDHKSCSSLPTGKDFDWAVQFALYTYGMRHRGVSVMGSIHSASKVKMNQGDLIKPGDEGYKKSMKEQTLEDRFARRPIHYTASQLAITADDLLADAKLAYSEHNHKRRAPDEERCKWKCDFNEACMLGYRSGDEGQTLQMLQLTGFTQEQMRH